jgi:preprotein translocase subunit YajC
MGALVVLAVTFVLLWVLFILPQQRRVRGHQALVASLEPGDEVVLTAGIYGRIVDLGHEDLTVEIAPGVEVRVARQAVLRRVEDVTGEPAGRPEAGGLPVAGTVLTPTDADPAGPVGEPPAAAPTLPPPDAPSDEAGPDTDDRGPDTPRHGPVS